MPPYCTTSPSSSATTTTPPSSRRSGGGGGGGGGGKTHGKGRRSLSASSTSPSTICRSIYCPRTETTYEGEIIIKKNKSSSTSPFKQNKIATHSSSSSLSPDLFPYYIKHGKGTIHNHRDNTTLVGFFQNNQIVGHAMQTFYDSKGVYAIAQYEGSFTLGSSGVSSSSSSSNSSSESSTNEDALSNNFVRHGFGKYSWPLTRDEYVGEFHYGVMQGNGTFTWGSTGDRYEGPWYKGRMHGEDGKKVSSSGDEFIGTFVKGRATGFGIKHFACGDTHEGMYRKDKRHGFGTYKWNSGDQYVGQWQHGRMFGRGVKCLVYKPERGIFASYHFNNDNDHGMQRGDTTEMFYGTLVNDKAQGYGLKQYASGDCYLGHYQNDMRHSYGVYTWSNGETYSGNWIDGHMCGLGIKTMINGDTYDGEFEKDQAHGFGVKTFASTGDTHFGEYKFNLRHGKGLYRWSNGDEYQGDYEKGEQSGTGSYTWNNGLMTFDGQWLQGQKHGPGFFRLSSLDVANEMVFFEVWSKGSRVFQKALDYSWNNLPPINELPEYYSWKHIWDCEEMNHIQQDESALAATDNLSIPMLEDGRPVLEPFADESHRSIHVESRMEFTQTIDTPINVPNRRHYSVDFYSSIAPEEVTDTGDKLRSCSFASYLSSSPSPHTQTVKGQRNTVRKVQYCKGGFVVLLGTKKKIRVSKF